MRFLSYWRLPRRQGEGLDRLVFFHGGFEFNDSEFLASLRDVIRSQAAFGELWLICAHSLRDQVTASADDQHSQAEYKACFVNHEFRGTQYWSYDSSGNLTRFMYKTEPAMTRHEQIHLKQYIAKKILADDRVLVLGGHDVHFQVPSGRHCQTFVRTGNALIDPAEISFLAFCLLGQIPESTKYLLVDTCSILPLAYEFFRIRKGLSPDCHEIVPQAFGSYGLLSELRVVDPGRTAALISYEETGGLRKHLHSEESISEDSIISVLSSSRTEFLLSKKWLAQVDGSHRSFTADSCPLCLVDSLVSEIDTQHFHIRPASHAIGLLQLSDFRGSDLFRDLSAQQGVISVAIREMSEHDQLHDILIDVRALLCNEKSGFYRRMRHQVLRHIPSTCRVIVHLDDPDSEAFARTIKAILEEYGNSGLALCSHSQISGLAPSSGSIVVVAAAVRTGQSLFSVSRDLRWIREECSILYLIGISMISSDIERKTFRQNLSHGKMGSEHNAVSVLYEIPMAHRRYMTSSWGQEEAIYSELSNATPEVRDRQELLRIGGHSTSIDQLYLPDPQGNPQALRPGFAFWTTTPLPQPRDQVRLVHFTIASAMQGMRNRIGVTRMEYQGIRRLLIDPANFERFNDGIIRSAILRCALPGELRYEDRPRLSDLMSKHIVSALQNSASSQGECAGELLLALIQGGLTLSSVDVMVVKTATRSALPGLSGITRSLAEQYLAI